jgi:hypothetical protein
MSRNEDLVEHQEFRIAFVLPWSQMVLAELRGCAHRLPRIRVPRWTRVAESLAGALQVKWAVRALAIEFLTGADEFPDCAVVEVRSRDWNFALAGLTPVKVGDLNEGALTAVERLTVSSIIAGETQARGPFSRVGWIEEAQAWIRESVSDHPVEFSEDVRQYNAGGSFALVRFGTLQGSAYWLKATGTPNEHELPVSRTVALCCPDHVPPLIAARTDWNAWVTEEVGQPLSDVLSLRALEQSAHGLAELQIISRDHIDDLLAGGCFDLRLPTLRTHLPKMVHYLEDAMVRQTSLNVPQLDAAQLCTLGALLERACSSMVSIAVPDTLGNNDMNLRNILFDGERSFFIDWSEALVSHPFLTFHHLWAHTVEIDPTQSWVSRIKAIYKAHWMHILSESQIDRALALCPPLAIALFLCGRDPSFISPQRSVGRAQSYARSLARHMDRAVRRSDFLEALCR